MHDPRPEPRQWKWWAVIFAVILLFAGASARAEHVRGYTRKDGTKVHSYERGRSRSDKSIHSLPKGVRHKSNTNKKAGSSFHADKPKRHPSDHVDDKGIKRNKRGKIERSEAAKKKFMKETGFPNGRPGYVIDHIVPLKRGGRDDPSNMQWQTIEDGKRKDKWE